MRKYLKKCLAVFLSVMLFACFFSSATGEVAIDLDQMSLEELKELQAAVENKIAELEGSSGESTKQPVIETDAGILVIRGYSIIPQGFKGFSNDHTYDNYSIFTVHATLTVKGDKPQSSWSTFQTQAYQNGIDSRRHTDFSKTVLITTEILPNTPVNIDLDFLVPNSTDPITFMVKTWGISQIVFQEEIEFNGDTATPKR